MRFLVAAVLLALVATAYCKCADGSEPEKKDLKQCQWYAESACCERPDAPVEDGEDGESPCKKPPKGCEDQINLLFCSDCSPDSADFTKINNVSGILIPGGIKICSKFADKVYKACKGAEFPVEDGSCKKIGDQWESSEDFWTNGPFSLLAERVDGEDDCFNAAGVVQPLLFLAAALFAALRM